MQIQLHSITHALADMFNTLFDVSEVLRIAQHLNIYLQAHVWLTWLLVPLTLPYAVVKLFVAILLMKLWAAVLKIPSNSTCSHPDSQPRDTGPSPYSDPSTHPLSLHNTDDNPRPFVAHCIAATSYTSRHRQDLLPGSRKLPGLRLHHLAQVSTHGSSKQTGILGCMQCGLCINAAL